MRRKIQESSNREDSYNMLLKTVKIIENKETKIMSQLRGTQGDTATNCNVVSWMRLQSRKRILGNY